MSTGSFVAAASPSRRAQRANRGLVAAEILKLRKRRGLVLAGIGLAVVPMLVGYGVVAGKHAADPDKHPPGGGIENFAPSMDLLSGLIAIAAILVGVTAGTGDLRAGVFRELVVTGRSRLSLFAARIPGGLALVLPLAAAGFLVAAAASIGLADGEPTPSTGLLAQSGLWIALCAVASFALALGVSSVVGSTGPSIGLLLGWQLLIGPLLLSFDSLGMLRELLPGAALVALAPDELELHSTISMPTAAIATSLLVWALVPLAVGAWRTNTRDA